MNNLGHIFESLETIFWVKTLKLFDVNPGSGMRDGTKSDQGSATLLIGFASKD
jgi:hypothetical protein